MRYLWKKINFLTLVSCGLALATSASQVSAQQSVSAPGWQSSQMESEAKAHAQTLWSHILGRCGDSYYYAGSGLDNMTMTRKPLPFNNGPDDDIVEYQGVVFEIFPPRPLSTAEQMNERDSGIHEAGYAVLLSKVFRTGGMYRKRWDGYQDGPLSSSQPVMTGKSGDGSAWFAKNMIRLFNIPGATGSLVVHMQTRQGKWFYNFTGVMDYLVREEQDLNDTFGRGAPIHQIGCSEMPQQGPYVKLTPETPLTPTAAHGTDGFIFGTKDTVHARMYRGSLVDFKAALPGMFEKATHDAGLSPRSYDREIAFILRAVPICSTSSPTETEKKSAEYRVCSAPFGILVSQEVGSLDKGHPRGIVANIRPVGGKWGTGQGYTITIQFAGLAGDGGDVRSLFISYGIVQATIPDADPTAK